MVRLHSAAWESPRIAGVFRFRSGFAKRPRTKWCASWCASQTALAREASPTGAIPGGSKTHLIRARERSRRVVNGPEAAHHPGGRADEIVKLLPYRGSVSTSGTRPTSRRFRSGKRRGWISMGFLGFRASSRASSSRLSAPRGVSGGESQRTAKFVVRTASKLKVPGRKVDNAQSSQSLLTRGL